MSPRDDNIKYIIDEVLAKQNLSFEKVGFYHRYRTSTTEGGVKIIDHPQYKLMAEHCFDQKLICFDDSTSLKHDGKKWNWFTKTAFNNFIIKENSECIKPQHIDNFAKMIKSYCFINSMGVEDPQGLVNVNNGIVDVKNQTLIPHTYKYMFKYCAPIDYDPKAKCPTWERFLLEVFENNIELIDLSQRLFGYILIGGRPFLHRAFVLSGDGRNGKSTYIDVMKAIIGEDSYSVVSMAKLDKEFSIVNIDGKLANIVEETPTDEINSEVFKSLVGGGEVQAAHKGFDEYKFRCNARFVFACNDMPVFKDKSVGLEDRLVFIPFNRYFAEHERDAKIFDEKLVPELSGILNWAIEGAKFILNDPNLPVYAATKKAKEIYREETDALYSWFKANIVVRENPKTDIGTKELYLWYSNDCEETGNKPYSKDKFSKRLRKLLKEPCGALKIKCDPEYKFTNKVGNQERGFNVFDYVGTGHEKKLSKKDGLDGSKTPFRQLENWKKTNHYD